MDLRGLLDLTVATPPPGWHNIPAFEHTLAPYTAPSAGWDYEDGSRRSFVEIDAHHTLLVHRDDPALSVAFGLTLRDDLTFDFSFADPKIGSFAADILLHGAIIHRECLLVVDGGRCYLPLPSPLVANGERVGEMVTEWEDRLARLIDSCQRAHSEYDSYFSRSGFTRVPGHPLDPR